MKFAGFTKVYIAETDDAKAEAAEDADKLLPPLEVGEAITLESDPARAALHAAAAAVLRGVAGQGAGGEGHRPAVDLRGDHVDDLRTAATSRRRRARFYPTELGILVNGLLVESFPEIVERRLHRADGGASSTTSRTAPPTGVKLLGAFYTPFKLDLEKAEIEMRDVKREEIADRLGVREVRQADGHQVGPQRRVPGLLRLPRVPQHQGGRQEPRRHLGDGARRRPPTRCARPAARRCWSSAAASASSWRARATPTARPPGRSRSASTARKPGCGGYLTEKRSRRGKVFFGCSNYAKTQCDFVVVGPPAPAAVPEVRRAVRRQEGEQARHAPALPQAECDYTATPRPRPSSGEAATSRPATRRSDDAASTSASHGLR